MSILTQFSSGHLFDFAISVLFSFVLATLIHATSRNQYRPPAAVTINLELTLPPRYWLAIAR